MRSLKKIVSPLSFTYWVVYLFVFSIIPFEAGAMPMRFTNWKTIPVGRYLVDVPEGTILNFNPIIGSNKLVLLEAPAEEARAIAQKRIDELKSAKHESKGSMFIKSVVLDNNAIVIHSWEFEFTDESTFVDIYYVAKLQNKELLYHYASGVLSSNPNSPLFQQSVDLAANLRSLDDGEIPTVPAFCMGNVMLLGKDHPFHEYVSAIATFSDIERFTLAFETNTKVQNYIELLDLKNVVPNEYSNIEPYKKGKTLRKKDRLVNGIQAQELCVAGDDEDMHYRKYSFVWATPGKANNKLTPLLSADLVYKGNRYSNRPVRPFPSDDAALAVWDRFVNSVRVRPVVEQGK